MLLVKSRAHFFIFLGMWPPVRMHPDPARQLFAKPSSMRSLEGLAKSWSGGPRTWDLARRGWAALVRWPVSSGIGFVGSPDVLIYSRRGPAQGWIHEWSAAFTLTNTVTIIVGFLKA